jgi:hypothetical protein
MSSIKDWNKNIYKTIPLTKKYKKFWRFWIRRSKCKLFPYSIKISK